MIRQTLLSALAVASLATAQTYTDCDPTKKDCPAAPALGSKGLNCDFTIGACVGVKVAEGTQLTYSKDKGALFSITDPAQAPTVATQDYIFFGRVEVVAQATPGRGVITSIVLLSDTLDELDWEWVGGVTTEVQSNCFSKGVNKFNCQGIYPLAEPMSAFHTYVIDWTAERIEWSIDGSVVKTLRYADAKGGEGYPQTPSQVKLGTWVAGKEGAPQGTIDWAGGLADFSQAPFNAYYKSLKIVDYAGGKSAAPDGVKEYAYSDRTGTWQGVKVVKEDADSAVTSAVPASTTQAALPTTFATSTVAAVPTATAVPTTPKPDDDNGSWFGNYKPIFSWPSKPKWSAWSDWSDWSESNPKFRFHDTMKSFHRSKGFSRKGRHSHEDRD